MAYEDYSVQQFMDAWFKGDRSVMTDEIFKTVLTEYTDTTGLYDQDEFSRSCTIQYLNGRVNSIKMAIRLQKGFMDNFGIPFTMELKFFKKFGHILYWNNDPVKFLDALKKIEQKEGKYISQLEGEIKKLFELRLEKQKGEHEPKNDRPSFIKTINSLGKMGYKIDKKETSVEEFSYMIRQQLEENEQKTQT